MAKHIYFPFWARVPRYLLAYTTALTLLSFVSPFVISSIIYQGSAQTPNEQNVDQLIENFNNEDLLQQLNIATTLGKLNDREFSREVLDKLKLALVNPDWRIRSGAALALAQKGGVIAKDALPNLVKNLQDPNWFVRSSAARAIGNLVAEDNGEPNPANTVVEVATFARYLVDALQDSDFSVRFSASTALIRLNTKSSFTVSRLLANLSNTNDTQIRLATIENLKTITKEVAPLVPNIAKALKNSDPSVRGLTIETIGSIGTDASVSVPYLIAGLQDPDAIVRSKAARTIVKIAINLQDKARANFVSSSDLNTIDDLQKIQGILKDPKNHFYNNEKETVSLAINALQAAGRNR